MSSRDQDAEVAAILDVDESELESIYADVQDALERVANLNIRIREPEDFDRVRQALPTEPSRARLVEAALPDPLRDAIQYVRPSERQSGYWQRKRRHDPEAYSDAELRHRIEFARAAQEQRGEEGVTQTGDGRVISRTARGVGDALEGREYGESSVSEGKGKGILARILDAL